jgi:hypothetical protein
MTSTLRAASTLAMALLAALPARAQTPQPPAPQAGADTPALPAPGALPASASEQARALWTQLVAATAGEASEPIRAFDLSFDARVYSGEKQSNDGAARYLFLAPGFVRMVLESGRERMRGPDGDFLVDKSGVYPLRGRDFAEDVRELEETVAVARLFVGLTDPSTLRLASLDVLPAAPGRLPEGLAQRAAQLDWIVVTSPDFRGRTDDSRVTLDRVEIGLERGTHLPLLALVTDPREPGSAVLARLEQYQPLDGYRVPWKVTTWRVTPGPAGAAPRPFEDKPAVKLWLKQGRLRPSLQADDFKPRG